MQLPQWDASVASDTQAPLHTASPLGQDCPHTPPEHVALPPVGAGHAVHDAPHDVTAASDTQLVPQRCVPAAQTHALAALHAPPEGDEHAPEVRGEAEQAALPLTHATTPAWAHPPLPLEVHAPPSAMQLAPHRLVPDGQTVPHTPDEQLCPAGHTRPHAPQLEPSLDSNTHAPAHRVVPLGHEAPHTPPTHVAVPLTGAPHAVHDDPHDVTAVSDTQVMPQRWVLAAHTGGPPASVAPASEGRASTATGASTLAASAATGASTLVASAATVASTLAAPASPPSVALSMRFGASSRSGPATSATGASAVAPSAGRTGYGRLPAPQPEITPAHKAAQLQRVEDFITGRLRPR